MGATVPLVRIRLSVMMFLQFMLWASWYVPIGGYMNDVLKFTGPQIGWIYATTAIGAILSPMFVGYIADRLFATERVLAVLHLVGGVCLFLASQQKAFIPLMVLLVVNALCFMPTLALVNSLSFRNIDDPNRFSRIAVFGTIGWIVSGLLVDFALGGAKSGWFFYLAGGGAVAMALYSLTLPHTPPKGAEAGGDVLGLGALKLLKDSSFMVFALCAFLISIPLTFYFTWGNAFLIETERPKPTALMTLSQVSEIFVMIVMPWFIGRIGLKNVLVVGMGAWALRYLCFASLSFPLIIVALLLHGFCYCFVFVASFIYVSRQAPPEISASAQSLVALLMWGVGMLVGTQLSGYTGQQYPPPGSIAATKGTAPLTDPQPLPAWVSGEEGVNVVSLVRNWLGAGAAEATQPEKFNLAAALGSPSDSEVTIETVEKLPNAGLTIDGLTYARKDLLAAMRQSDANRDGTVTRLEWQAARSHDWPPIWLWPGGLAAVVCLLFLLGGRDVTPAAAAVRRSSA
jgi:nucleoside transporter